MYATPEGMSISHCADCDQKPNSDAYEAIFLKTYDSSGREGPCTSSFTQFKYQKM